MGRGLKSLRIGEPYLADLRQKNKFRSKEKPMLDFQPYCEDYFKLLDPCVWPADVECNGYIIVTTIETLVNFDVGILSLIKQISSCRS